MASEKVERRGVVRVRGVERVDRFIVVEPNVTRDSEPEVVCEEEEPVDVVSVEEVCWEELELWELELCWLEVWESLLLLLLLLEEEDDVSDEDVVDEDVLVVIPVPTIWRLGMMPALMASAWIWAKPRKRGSMAA